MLTGNTYGGESDIKKRQCDCILSRIIYSYKMMERFIGLPPPPFIPNQAEVFYKNITF
jgi:hypothetical protein